MIPIHKQSVPQVLIDYKRDKNATFSDFRGKSIVAFQLVKEQFGLCAYCMSRITGNTTYDENGRHGSCKIEHFKSQSKYPDLQLEYKNMLGCCNGNEGAPLKYQTCDTHKGDKELLFNPADENDCKKMDIKFYRDGTIHSGNKVFEEQLNSVLNLNESRLVSNRKALLEAVFAVLAKKKQSTDSEIENLIKIWSKIDNGMHKPYFYVAVYYLKKHLRKEKGESYGI